MALPAVSTQPAAVSTPLDSIKNSRVPRKLTLSSDGDRQLPTHCGH